MSENVNGRDSAGKAICRISSWAKTAKSSGEWSSQVINAKITLLHDSWQRYNACHLDVLSVCGKETVDAQHDIYVPIEDVYCATLASLSTLLDKVTPRPVPINQSSSSNIPAPPQSPSTPLPKIHLPTFCDGYIEWQSFYDLYTALIHNNKAISKVEKFHYLRSSIAGEAAKIIDHITITDANYQIAWDTLRERFTNVRIVIYQLMNKLIHQQVASESVDEIKRLLDTTKQCIDMLTKLERPTNSWDDFIVHIIAEKLPKHSRQLWEGSLADSSTPATWEQLQKFLRTRFRTLEASSGSTTSASTSASSKPVSTKKSINHLTTSITCSFCGEPHTIARCRKYASTSTENRRKHVRDSGLCFNCLNPHHTVEQCQSKYRCHFCNKSHHSLLHQNQPQNQRQSPQAPFNQQQRQSSQAPFNQQPRQSYQTPTGYQQPQHQNQPLYHHQNNQHSLPAPTPSNNLVIYDPTSSAIIQPTASTNIAVNKPSLNQTLSINQTVLLATAQVKATSITGVVKHVRVLIDPGSQISLISERTAQMLQLKRNRSLLDIVPVGHGSTIAPNGVTTLQLSSIYDNNSIEASLYVLPNITTLLPTTKLHIRCTIELPSPLADPQWHEPSSIDILLGADAYHKIMREGMKKCTDTMLAQNTIFGWILSGQINNVPTQSHQICSNITAVERIDHLLRRFWEIAEDTTNESSASDETKFIEEHFIATHERLSSGRYQVRLPFKSLMTNTPHNLGNSLASAISRLHQVERRNYHQPTLHEEYDKFMNNYEQEGHMSEIEPNELHCHTNGIYYLPHHAVIKPSSTSTKVRVVFDGSCKTSTSNSLNNTLLVGPTLQARLVDTLQLWRNHQYVICADIKQMYRQILIHPDDRDYQRIVWRRSPTEPIKHYKLNTVTYGTSSAPYLAVRTLQQLGIDESLHYPLASRAALKQFYVDDLLSGANDIGTLIQLQRELKLCLQAGGMELVKWASNNDAVLATIPEQERRCQFPLTLDINETITTLGVVYDPAADIFGFNINNIIHHDNITKRQLLSEASKLFDPIGWLEPVTIIPKIMMQKLWLLKLNWDDVIPESLKRDWITYQTNLHQLSKIKINRWTGVTNNKHYQLHGFSDASTLAYAAVVYLRVTSDHNNEQPSISFVASRSRVAPIKTISIPRLELAGAALLADLMHHVIVTIFTSIEMEIFAWCDSQVTLDWLKSPPSRWKVFICNRTSQILSKLPTCRFGYIKSLDNPADVATRGICPSKLKEKQLWWQGPSWLTDPPHLWPANIPKSDVDKATMEERVVINVSTIITEWDFVLRFSTLTKLLRITARILRFIKHIKQLPVDMSSFVSSTELNISLSLLIKYTQQEYFTDIIECINNTSNQRIINSIASLNPFIDQQGILRVGGRLRRAGISYNERHPIILPKQAHLTKLIIRHTHHQTLHGSVHLMLNMIRSNYWIIRVRSAVKRIIHECTICRRLQAKFIPPFMSDLPANRINPSPPFMHTAIDFAGPLSTKPTHGPGRKQIIKGYVCIFVCLATKSIHLEAVSALTSLAFIAAFNRFISRRGKCSDIYSDCGTNFVGANKIFNQYYQIAKESAPSFATENINWHFNPPAAPHFNGLAEAGVKAMKRHLIRVVGNIILTFEELATTLCQIEACLNSRPLCCIKDDPSQSYVLTPGHFLIGRPPLLLAEPNVLEQKTFKQRWHLIQQLYQSFWKQWQIEYLHELQQRVKWIKPRPEPKIDDIVIIKDENQPPLKWSMGRIIKLHPGDDNVTRVVTLKTQSNVIKRPVIKLCWLPTQQN